MEALLKLKNKVQSLLKNRKLRAEIKRKRVKILLALGVVMTGGAVLFLILFPVLLNAIINWQAVFRDGNLLTTVFKHIPQFPGIVHLYFWNLENPEEFKKGAKPRMREMGPYAYNVYGKAQDISFGPNEESMKFFMKARFEFNKERTKGSLNDKLTILNPITFIPGMSTQNVLDRIPFSSYTMAPFIFGFQKAFFYFHNEGVIKETTVGGLLHGEKMSLVGTAKMLIKPLKWLDLKILRPYLELVEAKLADNMFGVLHLANDFPVGPYELWSGYPDHSKFGKLKSYYGDLLRGLWNDPYCNMENGSMIFWKGPYMKKEDRFQGYFADLARPAYLTYKDQTFFHKGFLGWRYHLPYAWLASPLKNPENHCYCGRAASVYDNCDGFYDLGAYYFGTPIALSLPHLLYASPKIQSTVEGLAPDFRKHETYMDMNPLMGAPVGGMVRIQVNLLVKPIPYLMGFSQLPQVVYPLVWVEGVAEAEYYFYIFKFFQLIGMYNLTMLEYGPYIMIIVGLLVMGLSAILALTGKKSSSTGRTTTTPIEPIYTIDTQTEAKFKHSYPDLYDLGKNGGPIPPLYSQSKEIHKPERVRHSPPLSGNDIGGGQQRISSPPGAVE